MGCHRAGYRKPIADFLAAVTGDGFEILMAGVAGGDRGGVAGRHPVEKPSIKFLVDAAGFGRSNPMRESAGAEESDALAAGPSLNASGDKSTDVEAALKRGHRRGKGINDNRDDRNVPPGSELGQRGNFGMIECQLLGEGEVDAALESFSQDEAGEIADDGEADAGNI